MQHALILTKNTLTEEVMVDKLQRLNYEMFCSTDLLNRLQNQAAIPFFPYFSWVFLSETLCNQETEQLLDQLCHYPVIILRITEHYPDKEEQTYWREKGLSDWVPNTIGFEEFREKLSSLQRQHQQSRNADSQLLAFPREGSVDPQANLDRLLKRLSKTEKKVFRCLAQACAQGEVLSRKELCEELWSDGQTSSNMSQLSCLINKLKRKFEQHGITGDTITTLWGRGYKLSNEFYDQWIKDQPTELPLSVVR